MLVHLKTLFWKVGLTAASLLFISPLCRGQDHAGGGAGVSPRQPGMPSVAMSATRPSLHSGLRPVESASQQSSVSETAPQSAVGAGTQGAGDQRLIDTGRGLFQKRCVQCHDAEKSLQKSRTAAEWRSTVARMARQDGAEIPRSEWEPISVYLAAVHGHSATSTGATGFDEGAGSEITMFGTISPTFRSHSPALQNPGFFPDVWAGIAWEPSTGPVSGKVVACISCHNEADEGYLSRLELAQASLTLDIGQVIRGESSGRGRGKSGICTAPKNKSCLPTSQFLDPADGESEILLEAGRIVVPFGAYSTQVNPGVYRTVSRPLMFNMGQRVFDEELGDPVLPMPYSDEGAVLSFVLPLWDDVSSSIETYAVNGLQGQSSINFDDSRNYNDNNTTPALGGRWTISNSNLRLGSSLISGQYAPRGGVGPDASRLAFLIAGADLTWRLDDVLRVQAEYARRNTNTYYEFNDEYGRDHVSGCYVESELLLSREARVSLLGRWDQQSQAYAFNDPDAGRPGNNFTVNRLTYGVNWTLPGGSLLMFNIEHWNLPQSLPDMNVVGVRWAASF